MRRKRNDNIRAYLVYKPDKINDFRLLEALKLLVSEEEIIKYFQKLAKKMKEEENLKNLKKCFRFDFCSANICPLDFYAKQRTYIKGEDVCQFTIKKRNKTQRRLKLRIPDSILKVIRKSNVKMLNKHNQKRWRELKKKNNF